jgi:hypothetical protein
MVGRKPRGQGACCHHLEEYRHRDPLKTVDHLPKPVSPIRLKKKIKLTP